jgi:hypothetical protein
MGATASRPSVGFALGRNRQRLQSYCTMSWNERGTWKLRDIRNEVE